MPTRNSPPHFTTGIGVYTPWRAVDDHVKKAQTLAAPTRKFRWEYAAWGKVKDNRRVRVRGRKGWLKPKPIQECYFDKDKGW